MKNSKKTNSVFLEWKREVSAISDSSQLQELKKQLLGKGKKISQVFRQVLAEGVKKAEIQLLNQEKSQLLTLIAQKEEQIKKSKSGEQEIDLSLEGKSFPLAFFHPLSQLAQKICQFFRRLGYQITESPEIDSEENNFNKLNMPAGHPAREMQATFYLKPGWLLRTHTTNIQSWVLSQHPNQELKIVSLGKVYRRDREDATHTHQFSQVDCFRVGKRVSFSHLKGILELLIKEILGKKFEIRFRPSYFPFTEPSVEVDASCVSCQKKGCSICKKTGWVEIAGAGLIHPQVLTNCGFNSQAYSGFAFAFGLERLLMIKRGVEDIRHFYLNDLRFLSQFTWNQ